MKHGGRLVRPASTDGARDREAIAGQAAPSGFASRRGRGGTQRDEVAAVRWNRFDWCLAKCAVCVLVCFWIEHLG